jgi:hypothetical protein
VTRIGSSPDFLSLTAAFVGDGFVPRLLVEVGVGPREMAVGTNIDRAGLDCLRDPFVQVRHRSAGDGRFDCVGDHRPTGLIEERSRVSSKEDLGAPAASSARLARDSLDEA